MPMPDDPGPMMTAASERILRRGEAARMEAIELRGRLRANATTLRLLIGRNRQSGSELGEAIAATWDAGWRGPGRTSSR